ncbi:MAG: TRAP transporter substrate-binding protein DctP [Gammaproteobacteria bacterium]
MPARRRAHLLAALAALLFANAAAATDLRMVMSWTTRYEGVQAIAERYARKVAEGSDGAVRFSLYGPQAAPPRDQLELVRIGIFDVLFTHGSFHAATTPLGLALDAVHADPAGMREAGVWGAAEAHYESLGLKLLALPVSRSGHHLLLRTPVAADCTLAGRRIRSAPIYHALLHALGAEPVEMPVAEASAALASGDLDGIAWRVVDPLDHAWHTSTRYFTRPTFGTYTHLLLMNLETWNTLDEATRELLRTRGVALEVRTWKRSRKRTAHHDAALNRHGLQATQLCGEQAEALAHHWAESAWAFTINQGGAPIAALRELARAAAVSE